LCLCVTLSAVPRLSVHCQALLKFNRIDEQNLIKNLSKLSHSNIYEISVTFLGMKFVTHSSTLNFVFFCNLKVKIFLLVCVCLR
jgi:hypothetical protein